MKLIDRIVLTARQNGIINVVIAGGTCSGKSTLAETIKSQLSGNFSIGVLEQDNYFKNLEDFPRGEYGYLPDSLYAFHTQEFRDDAGNLINLGSIFTPRYDKETNRRTAKDVPVKRGEINVFEGLHTISLLKDLDNCLRVFLDTDLKVCMERRIARDTRLYGIQKELVVKFFEREILPMHKEFVSPQKAYADLVI
ncbi:MAG: uridine kinase family protein [Ignavibacteriales bacterium]